MRKPQHPGSITIQLGARLFFLETAREITMAGEFSAELLSFSVKSAGSSTKKNVQSTHVVIQSDDVTENRRLVVLHRDQQNNTDHEVCGTIDIMQGYIDYDGTDEVNRAIQFLIQKV